jgi:hypothetical protein
MRVYGSIDNIVEERDWKQLMCTLRAVYILHCARVETVHVGTFLVRNGPAIDEQRGEYR